MSAPAPITRQPSHAGSWYTSSPTQLDKELSGWLGKVGPEAFAEEGPWDFALAAASDEGRPVKGVIAPHAGYSYSGPAAAWAYALIDPSLYDRILLLGPSHHVHLPGLALSGCTEFGTPLGGLELDRKGIQELKKTGKFVVWRKEQEEDEHSLEMHLPYLRKIFSGRQVLLLPIVVGSLSPTQTREYGQLLAPYVKDDRTLVVVSSDFCHWGSRFRYTRYTPPSSSSSSEAIHLSRSVLPYPSHPIHASITDLDRLGMSHLSFRLPERLPSTSLAEFEKYLSETENTICGRYPIQVFLAALAALEKEEQGWTPKELRWTRYERSSDPVKVADSSVSYASAVVR